MLRKDKKIGIGDFCVFDLRNNREGEEKNYYLMEYRPTVRQIRCSLMDMSSVGRPKIVTSFSDREAEKLAWIIAFLSQENKLANFDFIASQFKTMGNVFSVVIRAETEGFPIGAFARGFNLPCADNLRKEPKKQTKMIIEIKKLIKIMGNSFFNYFKQGTVCDWDIVPVEIQEDKDVYLPPIPAKARINIVRTVFS